MALVPGKAYTCQRLKYMVVFIPIVAPSAAFLFSAPKEPAINKPVEAYVKVSVNALFLVIVANISLVIF